MIRRLYGAAGPQWSAGRDGLRITGASVTNIFLLLVLTGVIPPYRRPTGELTIFSTGRWPVGFFTMVGWSSSTIVAVNPERPATR